MKIQVATMRYTHDGQTNIHLATTIKKAKEILVEDMRDYLKWTDFEEENGEIPNDYHTLQEIGYEKEYYEVDINDHKVHTDEHILKHVMETI